MTIHGINITISMKIHTYMIQVTGGLILVQKSIGFHHVSNGISLQKSGLEASHGDSTSNTKSVLGIDMGYI